MEIPKDVFEWTEKLRKDRMTYEERIEEEERIKGFQAMATPYRRSNRENECGET